MRKTNVSLMVISLLVMGHLWNKVSAQAEYQGHFNTEAWKPKSFPGFLTTTPDSPPTGSPNVTISVDATVTKVKIPETIFGYNTPIYGHNVPAGGASPNEKEALRHYEALNSPALRFPGGTPNDVYFWSAADKATMPSWYKEGSIVETVGGQYRTTNPIYGQDGTWMFSVPALYSLLKSHPSMNAVIQVNYSCAIYANLPTREQRVQAAADYAAAWVKDANITNGLKIKYWEVGNEIGNAWTPTGTNNGDFGSGQHTVGGREFAEDFLVFARTMKAVDPTIRVGATADHNNNFTEECLNVNGFADACDFLGVHQYYGSWGTNHNEGEVLNEADMISGTANTYRGYLANHGLSRGKIPLALTEYNTASVGGDDNRSYLGSMFFAKAMGKIIEEGYGMSTMFAMTDSGHDNNPDDLGMLATYPTEDANKVDLYPEGTPSPVFYPFYYYAKTFGDLYLNTSSTDGGVRAYASKFSNSYYTTTVMINQTNQEKIAELKVNSDKPSVNYYYFELVPTDGNINCRKVTVNGLTNDYIHGGPLNYEKIAPFKGSCANGIKIKLKPYGMYFVMVANVIPVLTAIQVEPIKTSLKIGNSFQFGVTYYDQNYNPMPPAGVIDWKVSGGATVTADGLCMPTTEGSKYVVTASVVDSGRTFTNTALFDVKPAILSKLSIKQNKITLAQRDTVTFTVTGYDQDNGIMNTAPDWTVTGGGVMGAKTGFFTAVKVGSFAVKATQVNLSGNSIAATDSFTVLPGCPIFNLGDTIKAANWCKMSGVKTEPCTDVDGGLSVGYCDAGDWMSYTINVPKAGTYKTYFRVSYKGTGSIIIKRGSTVIDSIKTPDTGDWQKWSTISKDIAYPAGLSELSFYVTQSNINWIYMPVTFSKLVVNPATVKMGYGETYQFQAEGIDQNLSNIPVLKGVTWSATSGTITPDGLFTAPASGASSITITATKAAQSGTATVSIVSTIKQTISLSQGWNLISFNVVPSDTSIASVFKNIIADVIEIKSPDIFYNEINKTEFNKLKYIEQGRGYWVHMKANRTLEVSGIASTLSATQLRAMLKPGWNLVGCPFQEITPITTAFDVTKILNVRGVDGDYVKSLLNIEPGKAYWVKIK